jgi:uncharacterized protein YkwD
MVGWMVASLALLRAGEAVPLKVSEEELRLLELTNLERKKKELAPLRPNPHLFQLARGHSGNMARQGKMDHVLDGKTPFDRLRDSGYLFVKGAENIAAGDTTVSAADIMKAWMSSKDHRENILLPEYTEVGVGLARDPEGQVYYTQVFARPREKE